MVKKVVSTKRTSRGFSHARNAVPPGTTVIGGVTIKLAKPAKPAKKAAAIRKAVKEYYAARRG